MGFLIGESSNAKAWMQRDQCAHEPGKVGPIGAVAKVHIVCHYWHAQQDSGKSTDQYRFNPFMHELLEHALWDQRPIHARGAPSLPC